MDNNNIIKTEQYFYIVAFLTNFARFFQYMQFYGYWPKILRK